MSLQNTDYFKENLVKTLAQPIIVSGLIVGYSYYQGRSQYGNSIMKYLPRAGIAAGAVLGSKFITSKIPISSNEGVKGLESMLLTPVMCSGLSQ